MASNLGDTPFPDGFSLSHRLTLTHEEEVKDLWYITHLSASPKQDIVAAGGPHGSVKLFMMDTFLYCGDFKAHEKRITGLEFSHNSQHCFWTASSDTSLSLWDSRKTYRSPVHRLCSENNCPFTSCGLNCSDDIVTAATEPYGEDVCLYFWDTRNLKPASMFYYKPLQVFTDSHNRDITQIRFSPMQRHQLATGSLDGLICLFDVSKGREDDCLESVLNSGSSVSQIGFYGPKHTSLHCLTHIETLQLWDTHEATMTAEFSNIREDNASEERLDYFVDCLHHETKDQLFLIGGTNSGGLHLFEVKSGELQSVSPLMGGHTSIVRCLHWDNGSETIITGGEDSVIACWRPSSSQTNTTGKMLSAAAEKLRTHDSKPYEKPMDRKTQEELLGQRKQL